MLLLFHVFELCLDVLLWEDEHVKFFRLKEVGALRHLLQEFGQQEASLFQEFSFLVAEALFLGKGWDVQTWQAFNEAIAESEEMLVSSFDLE